MKRRMTAAAISMLVGMSIVSLTAAPASAHSGEPPWNERLVCATDNWVRSCFEPAGDDFWVFDVKKDGLGTAVSWITNYGRQGTCYNTHGSSTWHECTYDLKENEGITFENELYDPGTGYLEITGGSNWSSTS